MPIIIDPTTGGFAGAPTQLMTLPASMDVARDESVPYIVDFSNYFKTGDVPLLISTSLFLSSTGRQIPNNLWLTSNSITGNVYTGKMFAANLGLGQEYQMQTTIMFIATIKVLTFITNVEVVA